MRKLYSSNTHSALKLIQKVIQHWSDQYIQANFRRFKHLADVNKFPYVVICFIIKSDLKYFHFYVLNLNFKNSFYLNCYFNLLCHFTGFVLCLLILESRIQESCEISSKVVCVAQLVQKSVVRAPSRPVLVPMLGGQLTEVVKLMEVWASYKSCHSEGDTLL